MSQVDNVRDVYLDKKQSDDVSDWLYFTVQGGTEIGDSIKVQPVRWPDFQPNGDLVETPGNVGLNAAWQNINELLLNKWGIVRERSLMIGVLIEPE